MGGAAGVDWCVVPFSVQLTSSKAYRIVPPRRSRTLPGRELSTPSHPLRHSFFTSIPFQLSTLCFAQYRLCRSLFFSQSLLEYKSRRNHAVYEAIGPPGLAPGKSSLHHTSATCSHAIPDFLDSLYNGSSIFSQHHGMEIDC